MTLTFLICTIDQGIASVPAVLLPPQAGVDYVVSWQYTDERVLATVPATLAERTDVRLVRLPGKGLSRNRNHALAHATGDICVIADDDCRYEAEAVRTILDTYRQHPDTDIALFQAADYDGRPIKPYPDHAYRYEEAPKGTYPCSVEMTLRRRVYEQGVRFDERFGLGSACLACGEEDVFLHDAMRQGFRIVAYPRRIVRSDARHTGLCPLTDPRVQRSKGATFCYCFGYASALYRIGKEAAYHFIHSGANPFRLFGRMYEGIRYIHRSHD